MKWFLALVLGFIIVGCGGGAGSALSHGNGLGSAMLTIKWPSRTRLIPNAANSLSVTIQQGSSAPISQLIPRPSGNSTTTTTTFNNLAFGTYSVQIGAFPNTDGSGNVQATGAGSMTVADGVPGQVTVSLVSTITNLSITPTQVNLYSQWTYPVTASATDADGNMVLLSANGGNDPIIWTVQPSGVGSVTGSTAAATLTAGSPGNATLTATMKTSDAGATVSGAASLVVQPALGQLPTTGYPRSGGDAGGGGIGGGSGAVGSVSWTASLGSGSVSTIVVDPAGNVYAAVGDTVSALSSAGTLIWQETVAGNVSGMALTQDHHLYVGASNLSCLSALNGSITWTYSSGNPIAAPNIGADGTVYAVDSSGLRAINPTMGTLVWSQSAPSNTNKPPLFLGTNVADIIRGHGPNPSIIEVFSPSGSEVSQFQIEALVDSACFEKGAYFYMADIFRIGSEVGAVSQSGSALWSQKEVSPFEWGISVSPSGTILVPEGNTQAFNGSGNLIWSAVSPNNMGQASFGSDGTGYAASQADPTTALSFNSLTGAIGWTVTLPGNSTSQPGIAADGTVYFGTDSGQIVAIK